MIYLMMLAAHALHKDPRIDWEVSNVPKNFVTSVFGIDERGNVELERVDSGKTQQIDLGGQFVIRRLILDATRLLILKNSALKMCGIVIGLPLFALLEALFNVLAYPAYIFLNTLSYRLILNRAISAIPTELKLLINYTRHFARASALLWTAVRNCEDIPDIIHCNDLDTLLVGTLAKRKFGCKLIYDAHELYPYSDPKASKFLSWVLRAYEGRLIKSADSVITVNPLLAREFESLYGLDKVTSIPNSSPRVTLPNGPRNYFSHLVGGRIKFIFLGVFAEGRGILELIEAWQLLGVDSGALFLIGPDSHFRQRCISTTRDLGILDKSVFFPDAVNEDELVEFASGADVGIIPYEPVCLNNRLCCPNKLSQYMQAGIAIVSNDLDFVRRVIADAQCGLHYDSKRVQTMIHCFNTLINDIDLLKKFKSNSRNYGESVFNWEIQSRPLYKIYDSLAHGRSS